MGKRLFLCTLLATAIAVPAWAQSATGGATGSASGLGNYGSAGSGSHTFQGNGLPAGVSGLPSLGGGSAAGSATGIGAGGTSR